VAYPLFYILLVLVVPEKFANWEECFIDALCDMRSCGERVKFCNWQVHIILVAIIVL